MVIGCWLPLDSHNREKDAMWEQYRKVGQCFQKTWLCRPQRGHQHQSSPLCLHLLEYSGYQTPRWMCVRMLPKPGRRCLLHLVHSPAVKMWELWCMGIKWQRGLSVIYPDYHGKIQDLPVWCQLWCSVSMAGVLPWPPWMHYDQPFFVWLLQEGFQCIKHCLSSSWCCLWFLQVLLASSWSSSVPDAAMFLL